MLLALVGWTLIAGLQGPGGTPPAPLAPGTAPTPAQIEQRRAQSSSLGRTLYEYDRAAWLSSDALTAKIPKEKLAGTGGYIVEQIGDQLLRVTYYRGGAADVQAFFVADVRGGESDPERGTCPTDRSDAGTDCIGASPGNRRSHSARAILSTLQLTAFQHHRSALA